MGTITDVPGVRVGHAQDLEAATGCTVVLFEDGARGAVDLRGGGTSTRQIDPLLEHHCFGAVNAVLLTGGSAYGLAAADGVMRYLEERGEGLDVGGGLVVPSVPTAVIFDLRIGDGRRRPDASMGYEACEAATAAPAAEGCVGAGTGATVGKLLGIGQATKSGIGTASRRLKDGVWVGALAVVNAFGDVVDPDGGTVLAGLRSSTRGGEFPGTSTLLKQGVKHRIEPFENTTLAVISTDALLAREELGRVARIGQTGIARAVSPCHTASDGDVVFALSVGKKEGDPNVIGITAAELLTESIVRAVRKARSLGGVPALCDLASRGS